jgi:hypothetical protein
MEADSGVRWMKELVDAISLDAISPHWLVRSVLPFIGGSRADKYAAVISVTTDRFCFLSFAARLSLRPPSSVQKYYPHESFWNLSVRDIAGQIHGSASRLQPIEWELA